MTRKPDNLMRYVMSMLLSLTSCSFSLRVGVVWAKGLGEGLPLAEASIQPIMMSMTQISMDPKRCMYAVCGRGRRGRCYSDGPRG